MKLLYVLGIGLYWLVWAPLAFLKDAAGLIAVPFDTQRCINTYIQTIRNAQALMHLNESPKPTQSQQQQGFRQIGYIPQPPGTLKNPDNC